MTTLLYIILVTLIISLGALVGIFTLSIREDKLAKILLFLISFSAGTLMGGAFFHLLPEASKKTNDTTLYACVLFSFTLFFVVEKILHWRHCHEKECKSHVFGYLNLFGDSIHNFIDGLIIAATFLTDLKLGIVASVAIALHEIPQEIGDFGVLLYSGFNKKVALLANFLVALTIVLGGIVGYFMSPAVKNLSIYLLPFAAGGFIYVSASDLMPEIRKETNLKKSAVSFGLFILGILFMLIAKSLEMG